MDRYMNIKNKLLTLAKQDEKILGDVKLSFVEPTLGGGKERRIL